ncbi:MAG: hypothetical protein FD123_3990 [Bacteroidetes bacterium]|nr:MAG: hypothetical protein FD123_3990 [Bacteroidota bacterium]
MQGRLPGTQGEKDAAAIIARELKKAGCKPLQKKKFLFPFDYKNPDSVMTHAAGNVIGAIRAKSEYTIVVGAHYDHLGWGKYHSNAPFTKAIHNGADDNASGVAMLLGLAGWCQAHKKDLRYNMVFIAYDAEEDGLYGSRKFLESGLIDTAKIACYLNFDMVGRMDTLKPILKIEGLSEYPVFDKMLPPDSLQPFAVRKVDPIFIGGSDNWNFEKQHIPGLSFSTGINEHYHKPEDDTDRINWKGMVQASAYVREFILALHKTPDLGKLVR